MVSKINGEIDKGYENIKNNIGVNKLKTSNVLNKHTYKTKDRVNRSVEYNRGIILWK